MSEQPTGTVTIKGRTFRLGAWYAPRKACASAKPRRLESFTDGWVDGVMRPGGTVRHGTEYDGGHIIHDQCSGLRWAQWAGEEIEA